MESDYNLPRYVEMCIKKTSFPNKFRTELIRLGVVFKESPLDAKGRKIFDYESFTESEVPILLPQGWNLAKGDKRDVLVLKNETGAVVFAVLFSDNRGYQSWAKLE